MENKEISNHAELVLRIMDLKAEKFSREEDLKYTFKEFVSTLNPISMVKESLHQLAADRDVKFDLAKVGLNLGVDFIIDKVLGRNRSVKGFLSSVLIEKFSTLFLNNNISKIVSEISKLLHPNSEQETIQQENSFSRK
jgi:hypothetical protein